MKLTCRILFLTAAVICQCLYGRPAPGFSIGEELHYSAWFNFIRGGESTLQIANIDSIDGRVLFHIKSVTKSLPFFDRFYKVRDQMESWIDSEKYYSYRFKKSIHEGKYRKNYLVDFDYRRQYAISKSDTIEIPVNLHDGLSMFYYVRTMDFEIGDTININYFDNDSLIPFVIKVDRIETVNAPIGDVRCFVLEPFLESGKRFKNKSKIIIYVSADKQRLPIMIVNSARFGTLTLKLESVLIP